MEILNLVQGSDEWLVARLEELTASEAPAMMGDSKFMSRNELLALKKGWQSNPDSKFKERIYQRGHDCEESARELAELELFEELKPLVGKSAVDGLDFKLFASFDGLSSDLSTAWEHKLYNATLAENVRNNILEPHYYWQLEHQMLVAGINEITFNASDGTTENNVSMMYFSVPERREKLIAGWKQFVIDLDNYTLKAKVETVAAKEIAALPSLEISLVGQVNNSNLAAYKETAVAFIGNIRTDLQTDQDFKDANEAVKFLKNGEDELDAVKKRALSQTEDIKVLFETIDQLKEQMRQKRLKLSKLTKSEKERIRSDIEIAAAVDFQTFITESNKSIAPIQLLNITSFDADFASPMKGKSTVESLQNSVDTKLAELKIEVNEVVALIATNLDSLKELASEHKFLFNDFAQLVLKPTEDLTNLIKMRISEHEAAEAERKRIEKEQIEKAAQEKAEREAHAKAAAEEQRIRNEERTKAQAEQAAIAQKQARETATLQTPQAEANHKAMEAEQAKAQQESLTSVGKEADPITESTPVKQRLAERFQDAPAQQNDRHSLMNDRQATASDVAMFLSSVGPDEINSFGYLFLSGDTRLEGEAVDNLKMSFYKYMQRQAA